MFCLLLVICTTAFSQIDTMKVLRDSIYNVRNTYTLKPLSTLINDLNVEVRFSDPDNVGKKAKGTAYYQNIIVWLPTKPGLPSWGCKIELAHKTLVDVGEMRRIDYKEWAKKMKVILGPQYIVDIKRFEDRY